VIFGTDVEHLSQISQKPDFYFSRITASVTNEPTNWTDHNTTWWSGGDENDAGSIAVPWTLTTAVP